MLDKQLEPGVDSTVPHDSMLVQPSGLMGRNVWHIELCERHLFCW
jgi:hypothetical protein